MKVFDVWSGRLGNSIFRYLASSLFCIIYGAERTYTDKLEHDIRETNEITIINDDRFNDWSNAILENRHYDLNQGKIYAFRGYFQVIDIYRKYRQELIEWLSQHPNDMLPTDSGIYEIRTTKMCNILVKQLLEKETSRPTYDVVFHIRLEDFFSHKFVIHPESVEAIIKTILSKHNFSPEIPQLQICFVCNSPKSPIEHKYIDYFKNKYGVIVESNDVITDYHIMKNSKILVCSNSTLSWCAAFLSESVQQVYFPGDNMNRKFTNPIENTVIYDTRLCGESEINQFFTDNM